MQGFHGFFSYPVDFRAVCFGIKIERNSCDRDRYEVEVVYAERCKQAVTKLEITYDMRTQLEAPRKHCKFEGFSHKKAEKLGLKLKLKLAEMFLRYVAIKIAVYLK